MRSLSHLFEQNKNWSARVREKDPRFFERLCDVQKPQYMWIGCSDSRVSADQVLDVTPGQIFGHRNVANLAAHTDINLLSDLQYAVQVLTVAHLIGCGHYGC